MDKRFIFRYHPCGVMGGRSRGDTSEPTGHGSCPAVARSRWEIPEAQG